MAGRRTRYYTAEEVARIVWMFPMIVISLTLKAKMEMMRVIWLSLARTLMIQTVRKGLLSTKIIR